MRSASLAATTGDASTTSLRSSFTLLDMMMTRATANATAPANTAARTVATASASGSAGASGSASASANSPASANMIARTPGGRRATAAGLDLSTGLRVAAVLFVTVLTALASQISVPLPFTPVPFTFQPMVVLLGGAALGARLGMTSQILYLLLGVAGLPVFAASPVLPQGAARLIGPTAGFLVSYPLAAWVTGWLAERGFDRRYLTSVLAMAAGLSIVFAGGTLWLAYGPFAPIGLTRALNAAVVPFIPADLVKICLAAAVLPAAWRFLGASSARR